MKLVETTRGTLFIGDKDDALALSEQLPKIIYDIIWNLAEELDFLVEDEKTFAKKVLCANIVDYSIPDNKLTFLLQLMTVVDSLRKGGKVFIHCFGGHGRTSIALASVKILLDKLSLKEALIFTDTHCDGPETEQQKQFIISLSK